MPTADADRDGTAVDVLAVGEVMAVLCPDPPGPLRYASSLTMSVAGAEANVAVHLAGLGVRTAFRSRIGADPFGELIRDRLDASGVTALLSVAPDAPTAVYFKDPHPAGTRVHYYRAGSAAAGMDASIWADVPAARLIHLSGITPALSPSCADLIEAAFDRRHAATGGATISFDINYRPRLWPTETAGPHLAALANRADVVFVGRDEAETLWGTPTPADIRDRLPHAGALVVKDGSVGATVFGSGGTVFEPTVPVEIVEAVGAGDAFASGYLYGLLHGRSESERLRIGHRLAANALRTAADVGTPITADDLIEKEPLC
jgi:2-dehydro-3-deoxygluconokinase